MPFEAMQVKANAVAERYSIGSEELEGAIKKLKLAREAKSRADLDLMNETFQEYVDLVQAREDLAHVKQEPL